MEFVHLDPSDKQVEEEALFDFAMTISPEKAGFLPDTEAYSKYLEPLLSEKRVHDEPTENFVAFSMLARYLRPFTGRGRFLPQCAPEWLVFRRLFLELCDLDIPDELRRSPIANLEKLGFFVGPLVSSDVVTEPLFLKELVPLPPLDVESKNLPSSDFSISGVAQEFQSPQTEVESTESQPLVEQKMLSATESANEDDISRKQMMLKQIVEIRLGNYEGVSLQKMKNDFVEHGRTTADAECGALYEVKQNIPWEMFPDSLEFETANAESSTARCISRLTKDAGLSLDLAALYPKAALSVREVLFDLTIESTFGKQIDLMASYRDLEDALCMRLLVEDPLSIDSDEKVRAFLIENLSGTDSAGVNFARSIAASKEAFLKKLKPNHHESIKVLR